MPGSLLRNNGPFHGTEFTRPGKQLLFDPATKRLMLPPSSQDIPLQAVGQAFRRKELEVRAGSYSDRQDAIAAWNAGQSAAGALMRAAFDAAAWEDGGREYHSDDEATARNQVYAYPGNVIAQRMWIWALSARLPAAATGLARLTSVSLRARPYQSSPSTGDPSGAALSFAAGVSATDSPLAAAADILALPSAALDMSRPADYQDVAIPCDCDVSGDKWLFLYAFPASFNPLKLLRSWSGAGEGSVCRADVRHVRSGHYSHRGFRVVVRLEEAAP